jgi:hypothetical protein
VAQMNRYWGDQRFTSGPVYIGAIVVLLMLLMLAQARDRELYWMLSSIPVVLILLRLEAPVVVGVLLIAYLLAGLFLARDTLRYGLFAALVLTMLLSWGRNFMPLTDFFLDHVPGYDKFRAVTIILVVVELAAPLLGILYLDRLLKEGGWDKATEGRSLVAMAALVLLLLMMAVVPGSLFDFISEQEREAFNAQIDQAPDQEAQYMAFVQSLKDVRVSIFSADVWRSLGFVVAAGLLLLAFGRRKVGRAVLLAGIGVLVLADLWVVDKRYLHNNKVQGRYEKWEDAQASLMPHKPNAADMAIMDQAWNQSAEADYREQLERLKQSKQRESGRNKVVTPDEDILLRFGSLRRHADHRVLTLQNPFNDSRVSWFHRSAGGYHGAKLKRYQELIEFHLAPAMGRVGGLLQSGTSMPAMDSLLAGEGVLNMLNIRYLMYSPERPPIVNLNAMGAGWFVDELRWVPNADAEIMELDAIDPLRTAVVDERFRTVLDGAATAADPMAEVQLEGYATNELTYQVRSSTGGVVVFSEIWYGPDWHASINGQPVEHARVNYVLRGLRVPAGEHTVVFRVESRPFNTSRPIAMASSGLLIILVIVLLAREVKHSLRPHEE